MPKFVSFREAVTAYAHGATVWFVEAGQCVEGHSYDLPRAAFYDPAIRARAARAIAHTIRKEIRYEDPEVKFFLSW